MSFRIGFNGPVSADLTQLLRGVERQLNWHSVQAQGPGDTSASTSGVTEPPPIGHVPCPDAKDPHNPNCIRSLEAHAFHKGVGVGLVVGLIVGAILTVIVLKRSSRAAGAT